MVLARAQSRLVSASRTTQGSATTTALPEFIKNFVATIDFELMHDPEQFAQPALRKPPTLEPGQVFDGQIVKGNAAGWKMVGTIFSKWHAATGDFGEVGGEPVAQIVFEHGFRSQFQDVRPIL